MNGRRTAAFLALLVVAGLVLTATFTRRPTGPLGSNRTAGNAVPADGSGPGPTLAGRRLGGKGRGPREARDPDKDPPPALIDAPFFVADERGLPIRGADVRVKATSVATDAQGYVLLRIPEGIGTYVLVDKEGYQRFTGSIDPESPETRIRLVRDLRSPLTVRLAGSEVADGVEVHIWLQSSADESVVEECLAPASAGAVAFEPRVEPGSYLVAASAPGLVSGPAEVRVLAGVPAGVVVEMAPPRTIRGTVKDRRGASVQGGQVEWRQRPTGSCGQGLSARCDDEGRFVLTGVPRATVEITASAKDFTTVKAICDAQKEEIGIVLSAYGAVEGTIDATDGGSVKDLRVVAVAKDASAEAAADDVPVHAHGDFALWLSEGEWRLHAENGLASGPEAIVRVPPGGTVQATMLPPPRGLSIAGRVVNSSGAPAAATVLIERLAGDAAPAGRAIAVPTDDQGRFEAARLPRGRYSVISTAPEGPNGWRADVEAGTTDVRLVAEDSHTFSVELTGGARPLAADRRMVFYSADALIPIESPDVSEDGTIRQPWLPAGRYLVSCAAGPLVAETAEPGNLAEPATEDDRLSLRLALSPGATITGIVRDAKGAARPGVAVEAHRLRLAWDKTATTDEHGAFKLIGLLPGTWRLVARDAEGRATHATTVVVEGASAHVVELAPVPK